MITSLKIAKVVHLTALKFTAAKSVIGVGALVAAGATGMVVTEQLGPDYIDAAVVLIAHAVAAEAGLPTEVVAGESIDPVLLSSKLMNSSDARGTISTDAGIVKSRKIRASDEETGARSVAK